MESSHDERSPEITHFLWQEQDLLPTGHSLAFNRENGTLALLFCEGGTAYMQQERRIPRSEQGLLTLLLTSYPRDCSNEAIEALIRRESKAAWTPHHCYRLNSRLRKRLRILGLDIVNIYETGYGLRTYVPQKRGKA